ncbi:MAG: tryptophan synthase subunit alpha [Thermodesulfobacteriota bacterium]|nr:tryptophan synthase subunit alpha [Thermodesulfobacteriota bacterium]
MNRIDKTFEDLRQKKEKALVGFITAGDPNISDSFNIIKAMCKNGLDILELGISFSDPTADGPLIQRSSARALKKGINLRAVFEMTGRLREEMSIPIILFSYYNPIYAYGTKAFYKDALAAGADGVLVVDLPPEESDEMTLQWPGKELALIRLIAPTTPLKRMAQIAQSASGFIYLVSKTGVTGSDGLDTADINEKIELLRSATKLPICVGFGISTTDDVADIASVADGVVIGSAFERLIENNLDNPDLASILANKVKEFKKATKIGSS